MSDGYAYIGANQCFHIVDVHAPTNPVRMGWLPTTGARGIAISGNDVFVADNVAGLKVIDVTDPEFPWVAARIQTERLYGVAVAGNLVFGADYGSGLRIVDATNAHGPAVIRDLEGPFSKAIDMEGSSVYIASGVSGFSIVSIAHPAMPSIQAVVDTPGDARGIDACRGRAYAADGSSLVIADCSIPTTPAIVGVLPMGDATDVKVEAVAAQHAYVACRAAGLSVVGVGNVSAPELLGSVDTPGDAVGVDYAGTHAYVADGPGGLQIIDVSIPSAPVLVGGLDTPGYAMALDEFDGYVFVADAGGGLAIVDASDPVDPQLVGSIVTSGLARDVRVAGAYATVLDDFGIRMVDVTDPAVPEVVATFALGNIMYPRALETGSHIVVTGESGYLAVLEAQCEAPSSIAGWPPPAPAPQWISRVSPNPSGGRALVGFVMPGTGVASLAIYDCSGRVVRSLARREFARGPQELVWDGLDNDGQQVTQGVYFLHLRTRDHRESRTIAVIR